MKYFPTYYKEQQVGAFHDLVKGNMIVEEYEAISIELVKYIPYLDSHEREMEHFAYGLCYSQFLFSIFRPYAYFQNLVSLIDLRL